MSEFKFACPVCGQHMRCDSTQSGTVMECPTCFQKITAPQAPASDESKFIITGTKVGERPAPTVPTDLGLITHKEKYVPLWTFVSVFLVCAAVAGVFIMREIKNKREAEQNQPVNQEDNQTASAPAQATPSNPPPPTTVPGLGVSVPTNLPVPTGTNYWTLDIHAIGTPDVPAQGKVHGKYFRAGRMILNQDGLTIRTPDLPPEAGVTIYLHPNPIESLYGKSVVIGSNTPQTPGVYLRWKNAQGQEMDEMKSSGYALRIEFGEPVSNTIPGKIYLCTPDEMNSYVVGNFNAEIVKPRPQ